MQDLFLPFMTQLPSLLQPGEFLKALFNALPGSSILLENNAPRYTILAATKQYVKDSGKKEEQLVGKGIFEAFPSNPDDLNDTGAIDLRTSFEQVLHFKEAHYLNAQRYDVTDDSGSFSEKYWRSSNKPVLTSNGEVAYILHTAEDITEQVKVKRQEEKIKGMEKVHNLLMQVPAVIGITRGDDHILEIANESALKLWGKEADIIGKPLPDTLPELKDQGIFELFDEVRQSGKPHFGTGVPVKTYRTGGEEVRYFDFVYQPYFDEDVGKAVGVFTMSYDVTEMVVAKRKIEEARRESEKQERLYETINNSFPDLIYVFDLQYKFTYANKALLTMWGSTWEQSIGKSLLENGYEPWHATMHEKEIDQVVATKLPIRGEVSFRHATYGTRVYDYIFVPVINENGEVEAVAGTTRDITDIKQAQQTIKESEERFRNLADESPMFVFIIDADPMAPVMYWNKTWLSYTGQSMEEALGRAWDGIIHRDDVAVVMEHYAPAFQNKQSYFIRAVRVKRHDGIYRWHTFKGNPLYSANGEFNGYIGVGFDIHEQKLGEEIIKRSEAELQIKVAERTLELETQKNLFDNILKNSSNGISVTEMMRDESGNIIDARTILANEAAIKNIGLPEEVFLSKTVLELDPNIFESAYGQTCLKTLKTGEPALSQYFMEITGRWQELTISKMDEDHLIHIFTDVTPIKEAQLRLEKTIEDLKRSNSNLEQFAYAASHDLKEPIRKITIFSDRLKERLLQRLDAEELRYFDRMEGAVGRMGTLVDDLLDYSQATNGISNVQEINLNKKVQLVLGDLELEINDRKASIIVDALPTIYGNKRQLQQLFHNLIGNALKYSRPGAVTEVRITARTVKGREFETILPVEQIDKQFYLLEIQDNGIGFDPMHAERIFNVFTRLHGNSEYRGTGVGLAIVRKVVENHKGFIWAESKPGEGATFRVLLPAASVL
ncbi:MAG: domain S-box protein [Segetibacter sp.]|nr:domain S-box protein [Segetibacter sp.]